jgi:integrase
MAGKLRYWKEKDGRFWARIAVPASLRPFLDNPRSELIEPLGGDRRVALRLHSAAVARLQLEIAAAKQRASSANPILKPASPRTPITTADFGRAVWQRYTAALAADDANREQFPSKNEIDAEYDRIMMRIDAGEISGSRDPIGMINAYSDYEMMLIARQLDAKVRERRLAVLLASLASGVTNQVDADIRQYITENNLIVEPSSDKWRELAHVVTRAEIQALKRTIERDAGDYSGQPSDPIVKPPAPEDSAVPVKLSQLWIDYLSSRVQAGFIKDCGRRQEPVIRSLRGFLKHDDARQVTKKDLLGWRDHLMTEVKLAAKTVSDIYLSTARSLFAWAHENERLPENVAEKVRQPKPRKVDGREKGYTDAEAVAVLRASRSHVPRPNQFDYVRETAHTTAAKRWAPILAAFSGARISEITQMRKEDVRNEGERWIARITPDAGSVKSGGYRDIPLHQQIIDQGFIEFLDAANEGPLFHGSKDPAKFASAAQGISDEVAKWLHSLKLVPVGVRPNYGWRHRLKTQALDLGLTMRVIDAMQGHSGRTAGENYGDVTIIARARVINALPFYDLTEREN